MKILLNTKMLMCAQKSGIGYYVFNLRKELLKAGLDVVPTLSDDSVSLVSSIGRMSAALRASFGKFYPPFIKKVGDAVYRHLHPKEAAVTAYDLYHETSLELMPAIRTPSACNIYDLSVVRFPGYFPEDFAAPAKANIIENTAKADRIIVNTLFIREEAREILNIPAEKIDVIPLAASEFFGEGGRPSVRPKDVRKITEKDYLLFVGTVEPRKNLKTLIKAFREIRSRHDLALVIAGGLGWLYDDIVSYPEELGLNGDVIFTNYLDDLTVRSLYRFASVFVYPSFYEGFGLPPLEAMACGAPVVASDIPPLREVSGSAAMFVNPADHEELAHTIERVLSSESLAAEMKKKGYERTRKYSWRKVAEDTIKTYEKALNS